MKYFVLFCLVVSLFFQTGCGPLQYKKVSAKDFPPDPRKRVEKNINEGKGTS